MGRSPASRDRRAIIAFGILIVVVAVAVVALTRLGGGDDGRGQRADVATPAVTVVPPTVATTTTTRPAFNYQVRRGETLTVIAGRFGVPIEAIVAANRLPDEDHVSEGQTLVIPPPPPIALTITPALTRPGRYVDLELRGAQPSESMTFEIRSPTGSFIGPPHVVPDDGVVTTTYTPPLDAAPGTYEVSAKGSRGSAARATFEVQSTP